MPFVAEIEEKMQVEELRGNLESLWVQKYGVYFVAFNRVDFLIYFYLKWNEIW